MKLTIEETARGYFAIVANGTRRLVICTTRDQAQRLLEYMETKENRNRNKA